jgi:tetratricopeptide (TPR) repeat protein
MKNALSLLLICLLSFATACSRRSAEQANANPPGDGAAAQSGSEARVFLEQGKAFYRRDQDEKALEAFKQALSLDPELAEAHFRIGLAYDALGNAQEAEESYKKAVESYKKYFTNEVNEKDAEAHYNLAQTYAGLHLYSEAVREYRQATRLKQDDADIYYDLGLALTRLAQYDQAVVAFEKSLEIDPNNFRAEDGLNEAQEGVKRIRAGKKHQEELLKKQKEEELKKQQQEGTVPPTDSQAQIIKEKNRRD